MQFKKIVASILCAAMLVVSVAGCQSKEAASGGSAAANNDEKVSLKFALWDKNQQPIYQKMVDQFMEENPNIKVEIEITPWAQYWTKLETAATGGSLADVFWMNGPNVTKYAEGNMMTPLDDFISKDKIDLSQYPEALVKLYNVGGKQYGIPNDFDTVGLFYNKEIFDNAGVKYPTADWTWDDVVAAAPKLTDKSKGIYGIAAQNANQNGFYNTMIQAGGYILSDDKKKCGFDDPKSIQGIQCWIDLIKKGVSPTAQQLTDTTADTMFESGKVAMIYSGSWIVPEYVANEKIKDKFDLQIMPKMEKRATIIHGLVNAIYSKTKYPEQAWKLVKHLAGKDANDIRATSNIALPAYKPSLEKYTASKPQYNLKALTDELDYAVMYPCTEKTAKWQQLETDEMAKIWAMQETPEEGCKKLAQAVNAVLATEK